MEIKVILKKYIVLAAFLFPSLFVAAQQNYNNIEFVENKGQWDARVKFMGEVDAGAFYVRSGGFSVLKHNSDDYAALLSIFHRGHPGASTPELNRSQLVLRSHVYAVDFVGANAKAQLVPDKATGAYNNYFLGNDPSKWASECRIYQGITMKNVYPNIDVRYYTDNGTLKYDIIARPGADISKIALRYEGANKLQVKNKELIISTSIGELKEADPYTYQAGEKGRKKIGARYVVKNNIVRFDVEDYDPSATLVIDPSLVFCSLSGSTASNWGYTATYGPDGSFYGGGTVYSGGQFNITPGAFQTVFQGGDGGASEAIDIGIIRLSGNGATKIYGTYVGGSGNEQPHSLIVDRQGNLVIAGRTNSDNYPVTGTPFSAGGGYDIVVTKLNAAGTALIGSKKIGGSGMDGANIKLGRGGRESLQYNYGDDGRSEVILDAGGNILVASCTQSSDFPGTAGFFQPNTGGLQDGVIIKLDPSVSSLLFASYLGGSANDAAYVLAISPSTGDIYVAGGTESPNFPGNHTGTVGSVRPRGGVDGFVTQISADGRTQIRSSYIATAGYDQVYGIQCDRAGFPYVMGQTTGSWPVINATYNDAGAKQFIAKLQPDLSAYVYSTVFGTSSALPNISPTAFLVDRCENVYVSGWGGDIGQGYNNAGTSGMRVTSDAYKGITDGKDFYFFVMRRDAVGPGPLYASFFGQNDGTGTISDHVDGGTSRFDVNGVIYQGVCANCGGGTRFPTTPGVVGPNNGAPTGCNLGMIKMAFNLAGVGSEVQSAIGGAPRDTAGCLPLEVTFTDQIRNATEYIWNFGDGTGDFGPYPADSFSVRHTFTTTGTFRVMLIAIDPNSCNVRDTSYVNIKVGDVEAHLVAREEKLQPCDAFVYALHNDSYSSSPAHPLTDTSFLWRFDDGSAPVIAGLNSITHAFPGAGDYKVWLVLRDTGYCNYPDSILLNISVSDTVRARFETDPVGCAPYTAVFMNTSVGGQTYTWDFGDPASGADNTSTEFEPTHLYTAAGTYTITLTATNPNTCNQTSTMQFTINVYDKPTAAFTYTPVVPVENTPTVFINQSSADAVSFKWIFGDGDTLRTSSRADVVHQYNATGDFEVLLVAFNSIGCTDTATATVSTLVTPVLDVPNAFTPNSGDDNSVIYVRGFGIAKMRWIIWNRWGQKVFETNNRLQGWNGRYKGAVQPMDVYAYTLEVEFSDGTKVSRKGDITLIR